ncbi:hypothetical protein CDL15_Pgr006020 [Punica granatum]|uniref:Enhancer of polycomb-like protein n=1 Tax=Punica granatum TaxID=22663 RepID=A0A218VU81_PUNGR|nr:hypothetical protein CDL15_Pgr006020 [Punica granatum]
MSDLDEKKYEIHFLRRPKELKAKGNKADTCVPFRGLALVVKSASYSEDSGFVGFLFSILSYMRKVSLEMSELSGFLSEDPIREVYLSHGIRFLWDPGFLSEDSIRGVYSSHGVRFLWDPGFLSEELIRGVYSSHGVRFSWEPASTFGFGICKLFGTRDDIPMFLANFSAIPNCFRSIHFSIFLKHHYVPSLRVNNLTDKQIENDDDVELSGDRTSLPSNTKPVVDTLGNMLVLHLPLKTLKSDGHSALSRHGMNTRGIEVPVLLEPSASGEWFLVVKREGLTRYTYKANEVMKPAISNRFSHATVWTGDNGWRLVFLNRDDWFKFKNLYKECFDRNKQVVSPSSSAAAVVKITHVPGVREVLDYEDSNLNTFSRPIAYIIMGNDEVSRALAKRTANYDMDCEDEGWLQRFNSKQRSSEHREDLEEETFELMIDAFEKTFKWRVGKQ